jgi:hypothetical protein
VGSQQGGGSWACHGARKGRSGRAARTDLGDSGDDGVALAVQVGVPPALSRGHLPMWEAGQPEGPLGGTWQRGRRGMSSVGAWAVSAGRAGRWPLDSASQASMGTGGRGLPQRRRGRPRCPVPVGNLRADVQRTRVMQGNSRSIAVAPRADAGAPAEKQMAHTLLGRWRTRGVARTTCASLAPERAHHAGREGGREGAGAAHRASVGDVREPIRTRSASAP